jgi:hypothetical protein
MFMYCHHYTKIVITQVIANKSFENVTFKYLGMTVTNLNYIYNEISIKLNSRNACCLLLNK